MRQYGIDASKIDVVYNGYNTLFEPQSEETNQETGALYTNGKPYFVFVGALLPRKNLRNLFFAFEQFKQKTNSDTKLVIVGEKKWWTASIEEAYRNISDKKSVIFTGRLEPADLNKVLSASIALTYVSYFEGFGIPILEAFSCGTCVITSNITSMPEVADDAALLVDPFSTNEIAEAMIRLAGNASLRNSLIEKSKPQLEKFSWNRTADLLWDSMEAAVYNINH